MGVPQETVIHSPADGQVDTLPENMNARKFVDISVLQNELTGLGAQVSQMQEQMLTIQGKITNMKAWIAATAIGAIARSPGGRMEISAAAAVTDGASRSLQPGEIFPGKGILIGEFGLVDAFGRELGFKTRWYDTAIELGRPRTFNDTADAVANCNVNGRGGLRLDPERCEADLFERLKTGEAVGRNVIAPLQVVKVIYAIRDKGEYKRLSEGALPGMLITTAIGPDLAHWQWSCTPDRNDPCNVWTVDFMDEQVTWAHRDRARFSVRVCIAELAL